MRVHSDTLTPADYRETLRTCGLAAEGVSIDVLTEHGSRKRRAAVELHLAANPGRDRFGNPRRWANTGHNGADSTRYLKAATFDEWGVYLAALYERDPEMIAGHYKGSAHFHQLTEAQYPESSYRQRIDARARGPVTA